MLLLLAFTFVTQATLASYCNSTDNDLRDKVVIMTGAANGIGKPIAENIIEDGVKHLIILDIDEINGTRAAETLNSIHGPCKAVFIRCDITTDLERVTNEILTKYGYVNLLVNNAGFLNECKPRKTIITNLVATAEWSVKFWEIMRIDKDGCGGTIINIASLSGYTIDPFTFFYKSSKAGIIGLSKSLGHPYHFEKTCVRVICVNPGFTYTAMTARSRILAEQTPDFAKLRKSLPWQQPASVAEAVAEVFKNAKSGAAWDSSDGKPPTESPVSYIIPYSYFVLILCFQKINCVRANIL